MKHYYLKISTSRHLDDKGYAEYKKMMDELFEGEINWEELEQMGLFIIRSQKPDEEVLTIYELSVTDLGEPTDEKH